MKVSVSTSERVGLTAVCDCVRLTWVTVSVSTSECALRCLCVHCAVYACILYVRVYVLSEKAALLICDTIK